jgi:hypothetical protein
LALSSFPICTAIIIDCNWICMRDTRGYYYCLFYDNDGKESNFFIRKALQHSFCLILRLVFYSTL